MEKFVNDYYAQIGAATTEAERAQIKAEYAAKLQTLPEEQRQQVKELVGARINSFLETLAPIDEAVARFNELLQQRNPHPVTNAA
jgi:hypothetical protein